MCGARRDVGQFADSHDGRALAFSSFARLLRSVPLTCPSPASGLFLTGRLPRAHARARGGEGTVLGRVRGVDPGARECRRCARLEAMIATSYCATGKWIWWIISASLKNRRLFLVCVSLRRAFCMYVKRISRQVMLFFGQRYYGNRSSGSSLRGLHVVRIPFLDNAATGIYGGRPPRCLLERRFRPYAMLGSKAEKPSVAKTAWPPRLYTQGGSIDRQRLGGAEPEFHATYSEFGMLR